MTEVLIFAGAALAAVGVIVWRQVVGRWQPSFVTRYGLEHDIRKADGPVSQLDCEGIEAHVLATWPDDGKGKPGPEFRGQRVVWEPGDSFRVQGRQLRGLMGSPNRIARRGRLPLEQTAYAHELRHVLLLERLGLRDEGHEAFRRLGLPL